MRKKILYLCMIVLHSMTITSCNLGPGSQEFGGMELELFGPLSKINAGINSLVEDPTKSISDTVSAVKILVDAGLPNLGFIPPIDSLDLTPITLNFDYDYESATFASGTAVFTIINDFPFNIKKGTIVKMTNRDEGDLIISYTLTETLEPKSRLSTEIDLTGINLTTEIDVEVKNISTDGHFSFSPLDDNDRLIISLTSPDAWLEEVVVPKDFEFRGGDTLYFNLEGEQVPVRDMEGTITAKISNRLPRELNYQIFFLDENYNLLDSLLEGDPDQYIIPAPTVDDNGFVISESNISFEVPIDANKYERIIKTKYSYGEVRTKGTPTTASTTFTLTNEDQIKAVLIGDLKIVVD